MKYIKLVVMLRQHIVKFNTHILFQ